MGKGERLQVTPTKQDFGILKAFHHFLNVIAPSVIRVPPRGEGVLPYIRYIQVCVSPTSIVFELFRLVLV